MLGKVYLVQPNQINHLVYPVSVKGLKFSTYCLLGVTIKIEMQNQSKTIGILSSSTNEF